MITKTETLYGSRVTENPIPKINANPSIVLSGNGKRFGITRDQLSTHCLMLGSTGTGKTNAILHCIKQLKASMNSEDVMLVFDSKLDFVRFHNAEDYVISNQRNGTQQAKTVDSPIIACAQSQFCGYVVNTLANL